MPNAFVRMQDGPYVTFEEAVCAEASLMYTIYLDVYFWLCAGWALRHPRGGCRDLHHDGPLAGVAQVYAHPLPAAVLQARHQAAHPGAREDEGAVHGAIGLMIWAWLTRCLSWSNSCLDGPSRSLVVRVSTLHERA